MKRARILLSLLAVVAAGSPAVAQDGADRVERLLEDLGSPDYEVRERATQELRTLGPEAVPAIEAHLGRAEDLEVEERLRSILADLRYPNLVGLWTGEIDNQPFTVVIVRQEGRRAVGANTCHWTSGPLTCGLESAESGREGVVFLDEPREVAGAGRYVARIDDAATEMSGTWTFYNQARTYEFSLRRESRTATVEDLESWLGSARIGTRCSAIHGIALLDPAVARPLLEKAARDEEAVVRQEATRKLLELGFGAAPGAGLEEEEEEEEEDG